jgi:hypothetical protein
VPLPEPWPGLVIRYDYLWTREAAAGREQGKERPACLVAAADSLASPVLSSFSRLPHSSPDTDTVGVAIPAKVREALGLDDAPGWIIVSEHNVDEWPNAGLASLPGRPGE